MIKIAAITAAGLLIAGAIVVLIAYRAGKAAERMSRPGVEAKLHRDMARFINGAVNGTSLDSDFWSSLSPEALKEAEELLARYRDHNKI
jgi:hypothetical protein